VGAVSLTAEDSCPPGEQYCPMCEESFGAGERCPTDGTKLVRLAARLDPFLGRELDGKYTILEKLGQGGMGAVYRATQHSVGREVAIKVVNAHLVSDPEAIKRFLREAKLASRLGHPNAVTVIDFGQTDDGVFYLVMELVKGRTLHAVIEAERVFTPERVVRIGAQVCDALEGAHALRIVHRDLKPSNIMLLSSGRDLVKVLDFGLAKSVAADQTPTTMTGAGALLGTPAFMPPELALGQPCDGRADLYSLGVVLYLLGSGRLPFQAGSAAELIAMHGTEPAPPMHGVPPALGQMIDRMLAKDPADRYQTAAEAREALEAALQPRYHTPISGVAIAGATNPSLGPFPAHALDAPDGGPRPRDSGSIADTAVALPSPAASPLPSPATSPLPSPSPSPSPSASPALDARLDRRRRSLARSAFAVLGAAAIGATAVLLIRSIDERPASSPPSPPAPAVRSPPPPVDRTTEATPPAPTPPELHTPELHTPELHTPELHTPELHTPELHTPELHTPEPGRPPKRPGKPPRIKKDPARRSPPAKPEPAKEPPPPATQGSGAPRPGLPF
jgi:eukaryotic-like serine/threonine-protein kinase